MSVIFKVIKLTLSDEIKHKINENINKMQDCGDWSKLDLGISLDSFDVDENISHESEVWEEISKVSIGLWNDYEHYRRFNFQSRYNSKIYDDRLKSLGFIYENLCWKNIRKPTIEDVQINVLMHCLCQRLSVQRGLNDLSLQSNEYNERRLVNMNSATARDCEPVQTDGFNEADVETNSYIAAGDVQYRDAYNDIGATRCNEDGDVVAVEVKVTEVWKCAHCHGDNLLDTFVCAHCHKFAPFFHKWRCESCSFFNNELCPLCEMCGLKNTHLRKCDKCGISLVYADNDATCAPCGDSGPRSHCGANSTNNSKISWDHVGSEESCAPPESRKCAICKGNLVQSEKGICGGCEASTFCCNNQRCGTINHSRSGHCRKCGLKKGSNVTEYNTVEVSKDKLWVKMWQCTFCGLFNGTKSRCTKCKNVRHARLNKKCDCNWVNLPITKKCDKCFRILK